MFRLLGLALLGVFGTTGSALAQADLNLQSLAAALKQGSEVRLLTPATNGMVQVTSFMPPRRFTDAEAAELVEAARSLLSGLGVLRPTGEQLAAALVGGVVDAPAGPTQVGGVLPEGSAPVPLRSEVIFATTLPQVIAAPAPTR